MMAPQRPRARPDLTIWLYGLCMVLVALGAGLLVAFAGSPESSLPGSSTPGLAFRSGLALAAFGVFVGLGGLGLFVAASPQSVRAQATAIAQQVRHPRLYGAAMAWGGVLIAGGLLSLARSPDWWISPLTTGGLPPGMSPAVWLVIGLAALTPIATLSLVDRVRPAG